MTDRRTVTDDLDTAFARIEAISSVLAARAREDLYASVIGAQTYDVGVSGSREDTSTERAAGADTPTYDRVVKAFQAAVDVLSKAHRSVTATARQCATAARDPDSGQLVRCERTATSGAHCAKCWPHVRDGQPPDAALVRDWNGRLDRDCECSSEACGHPAGCLGRVHAGAESNRCDRCRAAVECRCGPDCCPDGCPDVQAPGRTVSVRCHKRQVRSTVEARQETA